MKLFYNEIGMNCWEIIKCGREAGGTKVRWLGICPAYPDHGKDCAEIAGELCAVNDKASMTSNLAACLNCRFNEILFCGKEKKVIYNKKHPSYISPK